MIRFATRSSAHAVTAAILLSTAPVLEVEAGVRPRRPAPEAPSTPLRASAPAATLPYVQNFNGPIPDWTLSGYWHVRQSPQTTRVSDYIRNKPLVTLPDAGFWPSAYEGSGALVFSSDTLGSPGEGTFVAPFDTALQSPLNGGTSTTTIEGDAVLPQLDLTGVTGAQLSIWTWFEIESVDPAPDQFDAMLVQASTDGVAFSTVGYAGPAVDYNGNGDQPATSGGFNVPGKWVRQVYDLSSYAGQTIWVKLRFQSNDQLYNAFRGWFVDSLAVTANAPSGCTIQSVSPACVQAGGPFLIEGENFVQGSTVTVGGQPATVSSVASTSLIEALAPALPTGTYDVVVTAPSSASCSLVGSLEINPSCAGACEVLLAAPFCLQSSTGTKTVVIAGHGFRPGSVVFVGSTAVTPTLIEDQLIVFTAPALANGSYTVTVRTPQGVQCNSGGFLIVDPALCQPSCQIVDLSPDCVVPGGALHISGSGFPVGASVQIGDQFVVPTSATASEVVVEAPNLPNGEYVVQVTGGGDICIAPQLVRIASPNCSTPTQPTTWGRIKAQYR